MVAEWPRNSHVMRKTSRARAIEAPKNLVTLAIGFAGKGKVADYFIQRREIDNDWFRLAIISAAIGRGRTIQHSRAIE